MRIAVIDLGTNTFHLLIADVATDDGYEKIFKTKVAVMLGSGGINEALIAPASFERGIGAMKDFRATIDTFDVDEIHVYATSAIRSATNGDEFVNEVYRESGLEIQVISGMEEAALIFKGVTKALKLFDSPSLIMDIGGGSVEFIIGNNRGILWQYSFEIGASRLLQRFKPSDPVSEKEVQNIRTYLNEKLTTLYAAVNQYKITELIGSSGSFDTLADMISHDHKKSYKEKGKTEHEIDLKDYKLISDLIIRSSRSERTYMKGLIPMRIDMIVVACILIETVVNKLGINKMRLSKYALKEGILWNSISLLREKA